MGFVRIRELSLFTGAGGGVLASMLLGHQIIGAVEINEHCQRVIAQRQRDGILEEFPIFTDIGLFNNSGCAELYRGVTDVITAGFPCQPFAVAGKGIGADDERNRWPETLECIRLVRPWGVLLENSANLLNHEYFGHILRGLAEIGYSAVWDVFSACMFGAPQTRERLFILAYPDGCHVSSWLGIQRQHNWPRTLPADNHRALLADWMETVSRNAGSGNGVADNVERLKAVGNGQVPIVVRNVFEALSAL
jgi:DNA (cytosine-5)-methyltransferase 1